MTITPTQSELDLRELLAKATPGPWFAGDLSDDDGDDNWPSVSIGPHEPRGVRRCHYEEQLCTVWQNPNLAEDALANAALIAAAVNSLPALLDENARLKMALGRAERQLFEGGNLIKRAGWLNDGGLAGALEMAAEQARAALHPKEQT